MRILFMLIVLVLLVGCGAKNLDIPNIIIKNSSDTLSGKTNLSNTVNYSLPTVSQIDRSIVGVSSVERVCALTGPDSKNYKNDLFHIKGTDLGSMFMHNDTLYFVFGDTDPFPDRHGVSRWRSNTIAITKDLYPSDCIDFDSWIVDGKGYAKELLSSKKNDEEITVIPTYGISANGKIYLFYMSVRRWGAAGTWYVNSAGIASSDYESNFQKLNIYFPENSNFIQISAVENDGYIYLFGIPAGRTGGVKLARVKTGLIEDITKYEFFKGNSSEFSWENNETLGSIVVESPVGELSVQYNPYFERWIMTYLDYKQNSIMLRESKTLYGEWTDPIELVDCVGEFLSCYGPYTHPVFFSDNEMYFVLSSWNEYNVFLVKADLEKIPGGIK